MKRLFICATLASVAAMTANAATWYVDAAKYGASGDGTTAATAVGTIQEAVALASTRDTVVVAPGVYDKGYGVSGGIYTNRVYVAVPLTFRSTGGAAVTHIVGAKDPVGVKGVGPAAIRCVRACGGTLFEGFSLRDGGSHLVSNNADANGGGFCASDQTACLVDCVVSNCVGVRGGALFKGTAVRTLITENFATVKGSAGNGSRFFNSLLTRNNSNSGGAIVVASKVVGCTIADMREGYLMTESSVFENSLAALMWSDAYGAEQKAISDGTGGLTARHSAVPYRTTASGKDNFKEFSDSLEDRSHYLFSPLTGDYRIIPSAPERTLGEASLIAAYDLPDSVDRYRDFTGRPYAQTGAIPAGCIHEAAPEPTSGVIACASSGMKVAGREVFAVHSYLRTADYPEQVWAEAIIPAGQHLLRFYRNADDGFFEDWSPVTADNRLLMLPPKNPATTMTVYAQHASSARYVDPAGDDANDGLTPERPFRTLQRASDSVTNAHTVIYAAAGDYHEGGKLALGHTNRLHVSSSHYIRFVGAGADRTFIRGKAATSPDAAPDGRGADAIRCVAMASACSFQGFTLVDGHSNWDGGDGDNWSTRGAAAIYGQTSWSRLQSFFDCVVTNCSATRGGIGYSTTFVRSRLTGSYSSVCGLRNVHLHACLIDNNLTSSSTAKLAPVGPDVQMWFSTLVGRTSQEYQLDLGAAVTNSIIVHTRAIGQNSPAAAGGVAWDIASYAPNAGLPKADPQFADESAGDFALLASSPAVGGGVLGAADYQCWTTSYDGFPIQFVGGRPTAGAFHGTKAAYSAACDPAYGTFEGGSVTNTLAPGESVTVTYAGDVGRHCVGLSVNGEFHENVFSHTYTAPAAGHVAAPCRVEAVFSTNWYVNAAAADNSGNAFTPETAKKTLAAVMGGCRLLPGDVVHAAPGVYDDGTQQHSPSVLGAPNTIASRVVIPAEVTLVADEGAERTFISGEAATAGDEYGLGAGAVRCVFLNANARLVGFTVMNGHTGALDSDRDDYNGAAIFCPDMTAIISDCIISNNYTVRRCVVRGRCVNCRFYENWATANSVCARESYLYNCVFDRNHGKHTVYAPRDVVNCVFGPNNTDLAGAEHSAVADILAGYGMYNTLCLGKATGKTPSLNCVFATGCAPAAAYMTNCLITASADLEIDDAFRPTSRTSPLVDVGTNAYVHVLQQMDLAGGQRIYNGQVDIGAYEFDWRPRYAELLGVPPSAVVSATSQVTAREGAVRLVDGASLDLALLGQAGYRTTFGFTADVGDEGALTLSVDGAAPQVCGAGTNTFKDDAAVTTMAFAYSGEGYADLSAFTRRFRGVRLFIR